MHTGLDPHHPRERTVIASNGEGPHRQTHVDPLAAVRAPGDPPWDVYLTGPVFLDIIFTGLDSAPCAGPSPGPAGWGRAPAASRTWRPRWPASV